MLYKALQLEHLQSVQLQYNKLVYAVYHLYYVYSRETPSSEVSNSFSYKEADKEKRTKLLFIRRWS